MYLPIEYDDAKIEGIINSIENPRQPQRDIEKMGEWTQRWQMEFYVCMCEMVNLEKTNQEQLLFIKWK